MGTDLYLLPTNDRLIYSILHAVCSQGEGCFFFAFSERIRRIMGMDINSQKWFWRAFSQL
ncbi:hypothetical protein GYMLUDRAFT_891923 [Collybiopsis luxurians FD-317 M1]|uniref:Unplaced genomic scaffold GYMLUscaffold_64, whole genome shotgun sequence n=1 Tax=Collybiopsis luxurians FD-317 M1 TaxID=944289 RepID=A0A0D0CA08_9AGAR|nr:hypothetical protein GYMLUDRAFT_891923 [Collybiopsis luxurians FD-317 M1]